MSNIHRLRLVAEYLASVRNEIAIEIAFLEAIGKPHDHCGQMPRSPRWLAFPNAILQVIRTAAPLIRYAWVVLGFWIFLAVQWARIRSQVRDEGTRRASIPQPEPETCLFGASDRAFQVTLSAPFADMRMARLYCPWIERAVDARSDPYGIGLLELLDRNDLWACVELACIAHLKVMHTQDIRVWGLQSYTAFSWFMTRIALTRVSTHWVTTEHYDRWAVLLDAVVRQARRSGHLSPSSENLGFSLIQHGSLNPLSGSGLLPAFPNLPYRLSCVSHLHVYTAATGEGFKRCVLSKNGAAELKGLHLFKPSISLSQMEPLHATKVLFIGHPACEAFHLGVLRELLSHPDIHCIYKPHPKSPMSRKAAGAGWHVVSDPSCFPECQLAIAYPSTLALEYREASVAVVQHAMNEPLAHVPTFARTVLSTLNNLRTSSTQ